MPYFTTDDDCRLYYTATEPAAHAPALVFLNGLAQTTTYWHGPARMFKDAFRVLRYDARGQGRSAVGPGPLAPERHVADLHALFDHLAIDTACLVGISHGAYIATAFTAQYPERVVKLAVCNLRAGRYGDSAIVARWLRILNRDGLEAYARDVIAAATGKTFRAAHAHLIPMMAKAVVARNSLTGLALQLQAMQTYPPAGDLAARVKVPALVINGGEDGIVPAADAAILAKQMQASAVTIAQAGHSLPVETPETFNSIVRDFLNPAR
jgi:3-oxoadipate enol-lactonase